MSTGGAVDKIRSSQLGFWGCLESIRFVPAERVVPLDLSSATPLPLTCPVGESLVGMSLFSSLRLNRSIGVFSRLLSRLASACLICLVLPIVQARRGPPTITRSCASALIVLMRDLVF